MAANTTAPLYTFPATDDPIAPEWPGTPIGAANTITRQKGRTPVANKTVDQTPGLFRRLLANSAEHIATSGEPVHSHDVVIHGLRVRAITNSEHLIGYWRDNWYSPEEWQRRTGVRPADVPDVLVIALGRVPTEVEAAYYSRQNDTVVFFNTSYYGQLKSWVLGAVGRKLAVDYGIHSIHGAVVTKDDKGLLYIAPTGTGKSTSTYGVMEFPNTRFHSDDWVYVRYAYSLKDGRKVSPARVIDGGQEVARGYQCYRWLEDHARSAATVSGRALDDSEVTCAAADLDVEHPEAYAYTSEKVFYLRSNLVENFPQAAYDMVRSRLENAPDVTPEFLTTHAASIEAVFAKLKGTTPFDAMTDDVLRTTIGRVLRLREHPRDARHHHGLPRGAGVHQPDGAGPGERGHAPEAELRRGPGHRADGHWPVHGPAHGRPHPDRHEGDRLQTPTAPSTTRASAPGSTRSRRRASTRCGRTTRRQRTSRRRSMRRSRCSGCSSARPPPTT